MEHASAHRLVVASNNKGKIREIEQMIDNVTLLSLKDIGFKDDIPEPYHTFEENARTKAETIHRHSGLNVFADDSGICVNALGGRPGVVSAHYSGSRDDEANLQQVLADIANVTDRSAYYKAVICLVWEGELHYFEGVCEGQIIMEKRGDGGFGYDPIFVPTGYSQTFAELPPDVKNSISHRGKAVRQMVAFIKERIEASKQQER
ncbi:non-canonical purine NTP diphosphatase [Nemorincola caseinilytica]|uniref:dITP/XTP pyrophosphatase n=1 Tax=Nemorincola caseinilytica TaxID=2054315 RepID=A0ABP8NK02_9BACT